MSALPDPKIKKQTETLRSSSTNMVRTKKPIKYFIKKQNQLNENLNNTIEVVSSFNLMEDNGTFKCSRPDLNHEINSCKNIKTKLPEV